MTCNNPTAFFQMYNRTCLNQTKCSFDIDQSFFLNTPQCNQKINSSYAYFNSFCDQSVLELSLGGSIQRSWVPTIITSLDAAIVILYVFMLISYFLFNLFIFIFIFKFYLN